MKKSPVIDPRCSLKLSLLERERGLHRSIEQGVSGTSDLITSQWKKLYSSVEHFRLEEFKQQSPYWRNENFVLGVYAWITWDQDKSPSAFEWLLKSTIAKEIDAETQKFLLSDSGDRDLEPKKNNKIESLTIPFFNQENFFLAEIQKGNGYIFSKASQQLKKNENFILKLVAHDKSILAYVSDSLLTKPSFMMQLMKVEGLALKYFNLELPAHKEIILAAINQNGVALAYAPPEIRNDPECVMQAVKNNGLALFFASKDLKNKKEIVLAALESGGLLEHVGSELREDKEIMLRVEAKTRHIPWDFFSKPFDKEEKKPNEQLANVNTKGF